MSGSGASVTTTLSIPIDGLTITAPPPEMISQRNVEGTFGISARAFLDAIRAPGFPLPVVKLGKLRLVERVEFRSWLRSQAGADGRRSTDGVDAVLREVGAERRR